MGLPVAGHITSKVVSVIISFPPMIRGTTEPALEPLAMVIVLSAGRVSKEPVCRSIRQCKLMWSEDSQVKDRMKQWS